MPSVRVRVQQADRQRLDAVVDQLDDRRAHGSLVDRLDDRPVGAGALGHLADVAGVGQRVGLVVDHEAEQRPGRPRLGEVEDVAKPARHDQPDERAATLEDRVRRHGRAVEDRVEVGQADARAVGGKADPLDDADGLVFRCARGLRDPHLPAGAVVQDDVGERPADVDAEAVAHPASTASARSRYFSTRTSQVRACASKFSIRH